MCPWRAALGLLAVTIGVTACTHPQPKRMAWLERTLLEDNQVFLERGPDEVAGKFARMALDPHSYLRGTAPQFYRDMDGDQGRTAYPAASTVLVVGDPHVENLGTFRTTAGDGTSRVEWNDFDAAAMGAYHLDVRRLALSFWLVAHAAKLKAPARQLIVSALAMAYARELTASASGAADGRILADLIDRTQPTAVAVNPNEVVPATAAEQALVAEVLGPALATNLKAVTRRLGAGVSSFPVLRYYATMADDLLLEVKEARPSPAARGPQPPDWANDAERIVFAQQTLQGTPALDPWLRAGVSGAASFRVRSVAGQRRLDVDYILGKLHASAWTEDDLVTLGADAGRLLARAHANAGRTIILAALHGDAVGFAAETVAFAARYGKRTLKDYDFFLRLLARRGPLLGWRAGRTR